MAKRYIKLDALLRVGCHSTREGGMGRLSDAGGLLTITTPPAS
jgi:hypothetical protein